MTKTRFVYIIVALGLLVVSLAWGFILMWRLFSLYVLVLLFGYVWARLGIRGLAGEVKKSPERCQAGESFAEEITVFNRSRLPKLLVRVQENTTVPGHHNVAAFNLSPDGSYRWQSKVFCPRRGSYEVGSLTAMVTDAFGFFSLRRKLGAPQSVLVYPRTLELPCFQPLSCNESGYGSSRWLVSEVGPDAARVREYVNGDTLNRIHWRSTAHTGKLMVKEFDAERSDYSFRDIWVILDMCQDSQCGEGDETTEEYGVTIAASVMKKYLDSGRGTGLIASGDQSYLFPPETGNQYLRDVLERLALMKATGEVPIDRVISEKSGRFDFNSAIIVITPSASEATAAALRHLKNRVSLVVAILLDPVSFGGTVSAARAASTLTSSGLQVYVVRRGDELERALDSRGLIPMRYAGT